MDGIYKRGKIWYMDYYADGKRYREPVGESKKLAEAALHKKKTQIVEGKFLDKRKEVRIRFEEFVDEYLELHSKLKKSYYTDCKIIGLLKKTFEGKCLHEITTLDIERFKSARIKEVSPATVNRTLAVLKSIFNRAIAWNRADHNPCKTVKLFKENNQRLRFLEQEEISKLVANCPRHLRPIVILALNTGMRKGEILGLKWTNVDLRHDMMHLSDTKNGEKREVPVNGVVKRALTEITRHGNFPYVFCDEYGKPYGDIKKSFFTALKKSAILDFHFHDLRHTFASHLVMSGVDLNTVRELLGHKSLEMTLRYSHLSPDHKKRAVDLLSRHMVTIWSQMPAGKKIEKSQES